MKPISDMKTEEIMSEAKILHDLIYNVGCYGPGDEARLEALYTEITSRGYGVNEQYTVTFIESVFSTN